MRQAEWERGGWERTAETVGNGHLPQSLLRLGRQPLLDELPAAREVLVERVVREVSRQLRVGEVRVRVAPVRRLSTTRA